MRQLRKSRRFKTLFSTVKWLLGKRCKRVLTIGAFVQSLLSGLNIVLLILIGPLVKSYTDGVSKIILPSIFAEISISQMTIALIVIGIILINNFGSLVIRRWALVNISLREAEISVAIVQGSIFEQQEIMNSHNSAGLQQLITTSIPRAFAAIFIPLITLVAEFSTIIAVFIGMLLVEPVTAFFIIGYFGTLSWIMSKVISKKQEIFGRKMLAISTEWLKRFNELRKLSIEFRLSNKEHDALGNFHAKKIEYAKYQVRSYFVTTLPRSLLELMIVACFVLSAIYIQVAGSKFLLSSLSIFVAAAYRLLPSFNSIIISIGNMRQAFPILESVDMFGERFNLRSETLSFPNHKFDRIESRFQGDLVFDRVTFIYPNSKKSVIKNLSTRMMENETVWIKGASGVGKSTLISLAAGIFSPTEGRIFFECEGREVPLDFRVGGISLLSQNAPLLDETFAFNLALKETTHMDLPKLVNAAEMSGILLRIQQEPKEFDSVIGENGARLSSGERQRLGLARNLFAGPSLLILDEPTANLDVDSENVIWNSLGKLKGSMTILLVSHRPVPNNVYSTILNLDELTCL